MITKTFLQHIIYYYEIGTSIILFQNVNVIRYSKHSIKLNYSHLLGIVD